MVLHRMKTLLESCRSSGELVDADDVMRLLRPFCADTSVAVGVRLEILQMLEAGFSLSHTDLALLILYRTQALVSSAWPDRQVRYKHIRYKMYVDFDFLSIILIYNTMKYDLTNHYVFLVFLKL